jgi:biotin operon repressor
MSVPEMAATLGVTEAKIQPVVEKLKSEGAIRVVKGRILPPA